MRRAAFVLGGTLLLAGCGLKGPLYLPDKSPAVVTTPAAAPAAAPAASPTVPKKPADEDTTQAPAPK